jgi:hypothetical protein
VLYRHYVELCDPGGVEFLAFGVDPSFAGCVDGLVQVDLTRMRQRKRARYLEAPSECATAVRPRGPGGTGAASEGARATARTA